MNAEQLEELINTLYSHIAEADPGGVCNVNTSFLMDVASELERLKSVLQYYDGLSRKS